tara:strand:- start:259 stop:582 length:324 start_codon:yes stop_codon:yes gene_type:complete
MKDSITIDLEEMKVLKEYNSLVKFGAKVKQMLYYMFAPSGMSMRNFYIKGKPGDVQLFATALGAEKDYMDAFLKNGLDDPSVLNNRFKLSKAISNFERQTGLKWPMK